MKENAKVLFYFMYIFMWLPTFYLVLHIDMLYKFVNVSFNEKKSLCTVCVPIQAMFMLYNTHLY